MRVIRVMLCLFITSSLGTPGRWLRFAGAEDGSHGLQIILNRRGERVCATEDASRGPVRFFERIHGLAEIVVLVERLRVIQPSAGRRLRFRRLCMKTGLELI